MKSLRMVILTALLLVFSSPVNAQERFRQFKQCAQMNGLESKEVTNFLEKWEKDEPDNAEMLYSWFLYYGLTGMDQIELIQDLDKDVLEHNAMLPDTLSQFKDLMVHNINLLRDKGDGMKKYSKAFEYINKAIAVQPRIYELYLNKIDMLLRKFENKYATAEALNFIRLFRNSPDNWTDFYGQPFPKEPLDSLFEDNMSGFVNKLLDYNEIELAQILNDSLLAFTPQSISYRFNVGNCYVKSYEYDKAIEVFKAILNDVPDNPDSLYMLAVLYKALNDTENCKKYATILLNCGNKNFSAAAKEILDGM